MGLLVLAFIIVPVVELYVFVQASRAIGFFDTLALLVLFSVVGAWLVKRQGFQLWRRIQTAMQSGQDPTRELIDGFLILLSGVLMLAPGFLTDVVGILLLIPPTRALARAYVLRRFWGSARVVRVRTSGPIDVDEVSGVDRGR